MILLFPMYNRGLYHAKLALPWSGPEPLKRCAAPERGRRPMLTGTTCIQDASALQSQQNALHQLSGTDGDLRSSGVPCAAENSSNIPVAPGMKSVQNLGSARHCQNCQIPSPQQIELVLSTAVSAATRAAMQTVILSAEHVQKYVSSVAEAKAKRDNLAPSSQAMNTGSSHQSVTSADVPTQAPQAGPGPASHQATAKPAVEASAALIQHRSANTLQAQLARLAARSTLSTGHTTHASTGPPTKPTEATIAAPTATIQASLPPSAHSALPSCQQTSGDASGSNHPANSTCGVKMLLNPPELVTPQVSKTASVPYVMHRRVPTQQQTQHQCETSFPSKVPKAPVHAPAPAPTASRISWSPEIQHTPIPQQRAQSVPSLTRSELLAAAMIATGAAPGLRDTSSAQETRAAANIAAHSTHCSSHGGGSGGPAPVSSVRGQSCSPMIRVNLPAAYAPVIQPPRCKPAFRPLRRGVPDIQVAWPAPRPTLKRKVSSKLPLEVQQFIEAHTQKKQKTHAASVASDKEPFGSPVFPAIRAAEGLYGDHSNIPHPHNAGQSAKLPSLQTYPRHSAPVATAAPTGATTATCPFSSVSTGASSTTGQTVPMSSAGAAAVAAASSASSDRVHHHESGTFGLTPAAAWALAQHLKASGGVQYLCIPSQQQTLLRGPWLPHVTGALLAKGATCGATRSTLSSTLTSTAPQSVYSPVLSTARDSNWPLWRISNGAGNRGLSAVIPRPSPQTPLSSVSLPL